MRRLFEDNIKKNNLFSKKHRLLLAVSGGVDSVVLAHLLKAGGYDLTLAHCNFNLRGRDSQLDEKFCTQLASDLNVNIRAAHLDVAAHRRQNPSSIQMAARELRYTWFAELIKKESFDYLLTAHHSGDQAETFFINLLRGTGIKGLKGMSIKTGHLVRPLLPFSKKDIIEYAEKEKIGFRTDKSNEEDKYARNFIRHHIIPELKKMDVDFEAHLSRNMAHLKEEWDIVNAYLTSRARRLVKAGKRSVTISKSVAEEKYAMSLLNFILSPYGFNSTQQAGILKNLQSKAVSGAIFSSPGYKLTIDRATLVLMKGDLPAQDEVVFNSLDALQQSGFIKVSRPKKFTIPAPGELFLDPAKIIFPLTVRRRKTGDKLKPFGMKNFKLLSDLLKEQKLNAFEKDQCRLLVNGSGEIIWVMGYRSDERYRVDTSRKDFIKLSFLGK
jgi:tRNA(Ile)-lysidine synthase